MERTNMSILLIIIMSMVGAKSFAHDIYVKNADDRTIYYNWINAQTELGVTFCGTTSSEFDNEYYGNIVIPETVMYEGQTYRVTSIEDYAFIDCNDLTSVTIPNSVTTIGKQAFKKCEKLTSVSIGNGLTNIGEGAFHSCYSLTSITIPNSVTIIKSSAFCDCKGLTSVTMGNGISRIELGAFSNCTGLTSVHILDLEAWCKIKFEGYDHHSNPLYYAHRLYIGEEEIKDLVIPNSLKYIDDVTFYSCSGLTSVTIPNSISSIGAAAFAYCSGLTSLTIPDRVTSIGSGAFFGCKGLKSITSLNKTPPTLTPSTFTGCYSATLQVPIGRKQFYMIVDYWNKFKKIVEIDPTGIENVILDEEINSPVYDLNGRKLKNPQKGINIINGKKVIIR